MKTRWGPTSRRNKSGHAPALAYEPYPAAKKQKKWVGTSQEWEDLCDNCGKCCEIKEYKGPVILGTGVMCPFRSAGRCAIYGSRKQVVKSCKTVTPENVLNIGLPDSCAYVKWARG